MPPSNGYSVRVFVPSGDAKGLRTIEKTNWSGIGFLFPRDDFKDQVKAREELQRPGVYVLWGPPESNSDNRTRVYIGETDCLAERLARHDRDDKQPFWQETVAFTSKDGYLNKAHVLFIEAQLVSIARQADLCNLANGNDPNGPNLAEADEVDAHSFLREMLLCLPIAGVRFFDVLPLSASDRDIHLPEETADSTTQRPEELYLGGFQIGPTAVVDATGYINGAEFVVLAGSRAAKEEADSASELIRSNRAKLIQDELFVDKGDYYELENDLRFGSPSAASQALLGRSSNGRTEWKNADKLSINEMRKTTENS